MKRILPLFDRLIVKRAEVEETTKAGIIVPQSSQEKPVYGEVLEIGPDVTNINVGEMVLFGRYSGAEVPMDGEKYVILREEELLGRVVDSVD